jgi:hypothetical protein
LLLWYRNGSNELGLGFLVPHYECVEVKSGGGDTKQGVQRCLDSLYPCPRRYLCYLTDRELAEVYPLLKDLRRIYDVT